MAFLDQHPGLGYPAAAAFGLLLGSFLNVVILRLPKRLEWQWKRDAMRAKSWRNRTSMSRPHRGSWSSRRTARTASTS